MTWHLRHQSLQICQRDARGPQRDKAKQGIPKAQAGHSQLALTFALEEVRRQSQHRQLHSRRRSATIVGERARSRQLRRGDALAREQRVDARGRNGTRLVVQT